MSQVEGLIAAAPETRCRNTRYLFTVSVKTGAAFQLTCGRWDCPAPTCGGLKKLAARELLFEGVAAAWERGERVRWMTLTPPAEGMPLSEVGPGWNRVRRALKGRKVLKEYAWVTELQGRGEPHIHALITGEYIDQEELSGIAQGRSGSDGRFGPVCDIRAVRDRGPRSLVDYMSKASGQSDAAKLAGYAAKAGTAERARLRLVQSVTRNRPVKSSGLWYPGGLGAASKAVRAEWADGKERIEADDWRVCQVRRDTGELIWLNTGEPITSPEVDTRTGLAVVHSLPSGLLQAA